MKCVSPADVVCSQLDKNSPCKRDGYIGGTQPRKLRDANGKCVCDYSSNISMFVTTTVISQTCSLDFLKGDQL